VIDLTIWGPPAPEALYLRTISALAVLKTVGGDGVDKVCDVDPDALD
jgi:hypothetical protein